MGCPRFVIYPRHKSDKNYLKVNFELKPPNLTAMKFEEPTFICLYHVAMPCSYQTYHTASPRSTAQLRGGFEQILVFLYF